MKMNEQQLFEAFEKVIDAKVYNKLKDTIVLHDGDTYRLFEKYGIEHSEGMYLVSKLTSDAVHSFSSLKYAVTWVTLDNNNSIYDANRILELDGKLTGLDMGIKLYERYDRRTKDTNLRFIYFNKLCEAKLKKRHIVTELELVTARTKERQLKKFSQSSYKLK
jgi:hypothetical protein